MSLGAGLGRVVFVCLAVMAGWTEVAAAQALTLTWDPSPDPSVIGYIVYAGTQSGDYSAEFNVGMATSFVYGVVPDQSYFFAVASYAEGPVVGPVSNEVVATAAQTTVLLPNPGDQFGTVGIAIDLQLLGMDSVGGVVTFSAAGLPPGLDLNSSTGLVSGTPTTASTYVVTVAASDGASTASQTFSWTIVPPPNDVTPPVVAITQPSTLNRVLTLSPLIALGGVADDDNGVIAVTWTSSRGDSGVATGTDVWLAGVALYSGRNDITIIAVDGAGNRGTATISIYQQTSSR